MFGYGAIEAHNKPLHDAMLASGHEWYTPPGYAYFRKDGQYASFPIGYITGPQYSGGNGNPRPYQWSVNGPNGWHQRSFVSAESGIEWAMETAKDVLAAPAEA